MSLASALTHALRVRVSKARSAHSHALELPRTRIGWHASASCGVAHGGARVGGAKRDEQQGRRRLQGWCIALRHRACARGQQTHVASERADSAGARTCAARCDKRRARKMQHNSSSKACPRTFLCCCVTKLGRRCFTRRERACCSGQCATWLSSCVLNSVSRWSKSPRPWPSSSALRRSGMRTGQWGRGPACVREGARDEVVVED